MESGIVAAQPIQKNNLNAIAKECAVANCPLFLPLLSIQIVGGANPWCRCTPFPHSASLSNFPRIPFFPRAFEWLIIFLCGRNGSALEPPHPIVLSTTSIEVRLWGFSHRFIPARKGKEQIPAGGVKLQLCKIRPKGGGKLFQTHLHIKMSESRFCLVQVMAN